MAEADAATPPRFETRKGHCEVSDGALRLAGEDGGTGTSAPTLVLGFGALGVVLLASGVLMLDGSHPAGIIFPIAQGLFGFWLVSAAWRGRRVSAATTIPLDRIESIDENAPLPGRRGHFVVHFDDDGRRRRRLIMLPERATAQDAETAFSEAGQVLRAARESADAAAG